MKKVCWILLCLLGTIFYKQSQAQDSIPKAWTLRQKLIVGGIAVQQVGSFYLEYNWWWKNNYHPFVIYNDGGFNNYSLGVDKVGHFYMSYFFFQSLNEVMKYGHFSKKARLATSSILPFTWALSIEIADGFSSYNFSQTDLLANTLGIGYGFLQEQFPSLQPFKFKFSYFPTRSFNDKQKDWSFTEDYSGHIYWLSSDVHSILPQKFRRYWSPYVNLAVGYGVHLTNQNQYERKFAIGIDWNLSAIPCRKEGLKALRNIADYIHYPAPGIRSISGRSPEYRLLLLH